MQDYAKVIRGWSNMSACVSTYVCVGKKLTPRTMDTVARPAVPYKPCILITLFIWTYDEPIIRR